ncbi:MAG: hypothetical protein ACI8TP_004068 [Acidimicrobiales bacterium]
MAELSRKSRFWFAALCAFLLTAAACTSAASDGSLSSSPTVSSAVLEDSDDDSAGSTAVASGSDSEESGSGSGSDDETATTGQPGIFVAPHDGVGGGPADFATINEAIAWAKPGDEILLRPGVHLISGEVVFDKQIILRSEVPGEAIITTSLEPPTSQRNDTLPVGFLAIRDEAADGSEVHDIRFQNIGHSFTAQAIYVERARNVLIKGNSFQHTGARAIIVFDTEDVRVTENQFLNPYLPDDEPNRISARLEGRTTSESYMDYGVMVYGSTRPMIDHNYFFGVFHQALSFKEGSTDASAIANTFEGFAFTALFVGQNKPGGNSFQRFGAPDSAVESGTITVSQNVFRTVTDEYGDYLPGIALRLSYFSANVTLDSNVVESAFIPLQVDCNAGGAPDCASGSLTISNNVLNGQVVDREGDSYFYDQSGCVNLRDVSGADLTVSLSSNTIVGCGLAYELAGLSFDLTNNIFAETNLAAEGSPQTASGNVAWNSSGNFGDDVQEIDPSFAGQVSSPPAPSVSLVGAATGIGVFASSAGGASSR